MLIREAEMAESSKPVGRQLLTNVRLESESSSEEEETPQFHKGILKQIEKMEQTRKKNEERKQGREKKDSKQISGKEEEIEFDYAKWVKEQCEKIKKIETECDDEKTVKGTVEECDLNLVSLARPAIELRRFNCKLSDEEDSDQENLDMKLSEYALKNLRKCPWLELPDWLQD